MNELKTFTNAEFGNIRTIEHDGEVYFVGKEIAEALGYKDTSGALKKHVQDEDKLTRHFGDSGQSREMYIINESGLYSLIISSKLESAKRFKRWITSEVLPSIRKTGGYIAGQENMSDQDLIAKALIVAQRQIEQRNKQIEEMQPKALFADAVAASHTSILIGDLAKLICQNGVQVGQKRLFEWMRENGFLIKNGESRNMPKQRYVEQGLFEIKESNVGNPDGSIRITKTTKVTGKGQVYFVNKFLDMQEGFK